MQHFFKCTHPCSRHVSFAVAEASLCSGHRHSEHCRLQHLWEVLQEGEREFDVYTMQLSVFVSRPISICYALPSLYEEAKWIRFSVFQDYQRMLDLIRDIILATDLAHHLRIFKDLQKMADGMSQWPGSASGLFWGWFRLAWGNWTIICIFSL